MKLHHNIRHFFFLMLCLTGLSLGCGSDTLPNNTPGTSGMEAPTTRKMAPSQDTTSFPDQSTPKLDLGSPTLPDMRMREPDSSPSSSTTLRSPASQEQITHPFGLSIQGAGSQHVGSASVKGNLVDVEIDGVPLQGFIQKRQEWTDFSTVLYQTLLISPSRVHVAWFYCKGDKLDWIYHESTTTSMRNESMTGSCIETQEPTTANITLPATSLPKPKVLTNYRIDAGDSLQIYGPESNTQSLAKFGPELYDLYPFEEVDCTKECGDDGWYELHTLMERRRDKALGFVIFYLAPNNRINAYYSMVWPGLEVVTPQSFQGQWSRR